MRKVYNTIFDVWIGSICANFIFQYFKSQNWEQAVERSVLVSGAFFALYVVLKLNEDSSL